MKPISIGRYAYIVLICNLIIAVGTGIFCGVVDPKPEGKALISTGSLQAIAGFLFVSSILNIIHLILVSESNRMANYPRQYAFSEREREIISLIHKGYSNKMIGESLFISPYTVKKHIYNIFRKANVKSRIALLRAIGL